MSDLSLDPPESTISPPPAIDPERRRAQADKAARFVRRLVAHDPSDREFVAQTDAIAGFGQPELDAATRQIARRTVQAGAGAAAGALFDRLGGLVASLDPAANDALLAPRRLFGLAAAPPRIDDYFARFRTAEAEIVTLIGGLIGARDALLRDNAGIAGDAERLATAADALADAAAQAAALDAALAAAARELGGADPAKAGAIRDGALTHARARSADLLTMAAVVAQARLGLDLVRRNNLELVKAIDRSRSVTIAALATAVTVADALARERLVLDRMTALDASSAAQNDRVARRLEGDAAATEAELARLRLAFAETRAAFESMAARRAIEAPNP